MSSDPLQVGEDDKLIGENIYYVWRLKIKTFVQVKSLWNLTIIKLIPTTFLCTYNKHILLEIQL